MNHLCLFFLLREIEKATAALRVKRINQQQVFLFPSHLRSLLHAPSLHLAVSTEKVCLSFKMVLGDLVTTSQQARSHTALFSRTGWQSELQGIFQRRQLLLTKDFPVCPDA